MPSIDLQKWDEEVDDPETDKNKLYNDLKREEIKDESNPELLYRLAKVSLYLAELDEMANRKDNQKQRTIEALGYSEKACTLAKDNAECHRWYCVSLGSMTTLVSSNKERIKYGLLFKEHADIALKLEPNDPIMLYMYGRWCYEVASLSWLVKKLAKAFYGNVPTAQYNDALVAFKKASQISEEWIECHLWIVKTLLAMKQKKEAKKWIHTALDITPENISEEIALNELRALNNKLK